MGVFNYNAEISTVATLFSSLTGSTLITITTNSNQSVCDMAVSESLVGTLDSNKKDKKRFISDKSNKLAKDGFAHTTASGFTGTFPIESVKEELSFYNTVASVMAAHPEDGAQIIPTIDGGGIPVMNVTEADAINRAAIHRLEYIYSSLAPVGGVKSQLLLDQDIDAALNQTVLDAILDTRV